MKKKIQLNLSTRARLEAELTGLFEEIAILGNLKWQKQWSVQIEARSEWQILVVVYRERALLEFRQHLITNIVYFFLSISHFTINLSYF